MKAKAQVTDAVNGYSLSRSWFDFTFENQDIVSPAHTAVYLWLVELNNRMGWVVKFSSPASQTMAATGIKSYNTYKRIFNNLVSWGFVSVITESRNQYTACIIALSKNNKAPDRALDKALALHNTKQVRGTRQSTDSINKPLNNKTYNTLTGAEAPGSDSEFKKMVDENTETVDSEEKSDTPEVIVESINIPFEQFWDTYQKKVGNIGKLQKKWRKLSGKDRQLIMEHIPKYIAAQPEKQYRKNPETYLNNQSWLDEIVSRDEEKKSAGGFPDHWTREYEARLSIPQLQAYWAHLRGIGLMPVKDRLGNTTSWKQKTGNASSTTGKTFGQFGRSGNSTVESKQAGVRNLAERSAEFLRQIGADINKNSEITKRQTNNEN